MNAEQIIKYAGHVAHNAKVADTIHALAGQVAQMSNACMNNIGADEREANAELIVRAVNQYPALVAHCNELNQFVNHFEAIITDANFKRACELVPELEALAQLAAVCGGRGDK